MKVLVTVKEVAEVSEDFTIKENRVAETDIEYDLNEWDNYAIEAGVQLAESGIVDEVVSVTLGPERAEETIRMALAKGVDRAVRVWDDAFEDQFSDVASKATVFEEILADEQPDLVLTGVQSSDNAFGATGVLLAERVNFEHAAVVNDLELDVDGECAHVRRELEGGIEELTEVDLPAVLTVQTGINEPRYASLRGIRQAQRKEIATKDLMDLGLSPDEIVSSLTITDMYEPESESDTELIEGDPDEQAARLVDVLTELGVGA